jgi:putative FmdB family regulatory protein
MPIYEFACRKCNADFETIVPARRRDSVPCPKCGSEKTMRKISLAAPSQIVVKTTAGRAPCGAPYCCGGACPMAD